MKMPVSAYAFFSLIMLVTNSYAEAADQQLVISKGSDATLKKRFDQVAPALFHTCPGLNRYAQDLGVASLDQSYMHGYEGGLELSFKVSNNPQLLPPPLNLYSKGNTCRLSIRKDGKRVYIAKRACHSICSGSWNKNNDPGLLGVELKL